MATKAKKPLNTVNALFLELPMMTRSKSMKPNRNSVKPRKYVGGFLFICNVKLPEKNRSGDCLVQILDAYLMKTIHVTNILLEP